MTVQEDINNKNVALITKGSNITLRTLVKLFKMYIRYQNDKKMSSVLPQGKQSVKDLAKQGQGISSLDLNNADLKLFNRIMQKYGVDYAITSDKGTSPPTHTLFFKGKDTDAITSAFKHFTREATKKIEKPSVINKLRESIKLAKSTSHNKLKHRHKEQSL